VLPTGPDLADASAAPEVRLGSDVVDAMGGHLVDARSRVDIRADDVPDGINAADHAAGRPHWQSLRDEEQKRQRCQRRRSPSASRRSRRLP
jgi:hypothetical protein